MNTKKILLACACTCVGLIVSATDAIRTGDGSWSDVGKWADGSVAGGAGATVTFTNNVKVTDLDGSPVIGHIVRPADAPTISTYSGTESAFMISTWSGGTNRVVFQTADSSNASVKMLRGGDMDNCRIIIDAPVLLLSDLEITHAGRTKDWTSTSSASGYGSLLGTSPGVILAGTVSDNGAGKGLLCNNPPYKWDCVYNGGSVHDEAWGYIPTLLCGDNTFTGDVNVYGGILRLGTPRGYGEGTPLGRGNKTIVNNDTNAVLDLRGVKLPADNALELGGYPNPSVGNWAGDDMGALYSSCPDPNSRALWRGPVTIKTDTKIGGHAPWNEIHSGDIEISGPINDEGAGRKISLIGSGTKYITGDNSPFTGTLELRNGFTELGPKAIGQGRLYFYGGAFRYSKENPTDISIMNLGTMSTTDGTVSLFVEKDMTYTPAAGFTNISNMAKSGEGTLVLNKPFLGFQGRSIGGGGAFWLDDGDVVFDYTSLSAGDKLADNAAIAFGAAGRLIVKQTNDGEHTPGTSLQSWSYAVATLVNQGSGRTPLASFDDSRNDMGIYFVDAGADAGYWTTTASTNRAGLVNPRVIARRGDEVGPAVKNGNDVMPMPVERMATAFGGGPDKFVSVTAANSASAFSEIRAAGLYFGTPNGGTKIELVLSGTNILSQGQIIVAPSMGNTPVKISGGRFASDSWSANSQFPFFTIANFNTNATLELDCEFAPDLFTLDGSGYVIAETTKTKGVLFIIGPGKTVLKSGMRNYFQNGVLIAHGNVVVEEPLALMNARSTAIRLCQARLTADFYGKPDGYTSVNGEGLFAAKSGSTYYYPALSIMRPGGEIDIPEGHDLMMNINATHNGTGGYAYLYGGAFFRKTGKGRLARGTSLLPITSSIGSWHGQIVYPKRIEVSEGTWYTPLKEQFNTTRGYELYSGVGGSESAIFTLGANAKMEGRVLWANLSCGEGGSGMIYPNEGSGSYCYRQEGVATFDYAWADNNTSVSTVPNLFALWIASNDKGTGFPFPGPRGNGMFTGTNDIIVTNSLGTAKGFAFEGYYTADYTGTVRQGMPFSSSFGSRLPNAGLDIPAGFTNTYGATAIEPNFMVEWGRLTGAGTLVVDCADKDVDQGLWLGCDDRSTNVFSGSLQLKKNGDCNRCRFVKTGSTTQVIAGDDNEMYATAVVDAGRLVLAAGKTGDKKGPLGSATVTFGNGTAPELLVDGAYSIDNAVMVSSNRSESAGLPTIGGTASANGAVFSGNMTVHSALALKAESGTTVTFSGDITGSGCLFASGAGKVLLTGTVSAVLGGWDGESAALEIAGTYTIPQNSIFTFYGNAASLDESKSYTVLSAERITGEFVSALGIPSGWELRYRKTNGVVTSVQLVSMRGTVIVFR